jgi:molybdopterin converting factor small subunit
MPFLKLYANPRKLAGMKDLSIAGATIRAVLNELVQQKSPIAEVLLENGQLCQHIILTVNGQNITDLETPVAEQDMLAVFPPLAVKQINEPFLEYRKMSESYNQF